MRTAIPRTAHVLAAGFLVLSASAACAAEAAQRVLDLSGSVRARYEGLDGAFRAGGAIDDGLVALRTILRADFRRGALTAAVEVMDSRVAFADDGARVGTAFVNSAEPVNAWIAWNRPGARVRVGRFAEDLGSRRLVARNIYRNTTNVFDGADLLLRRERSSLRLLAWLPVDRRPSAGEALDDQRVRIDESHPEQRLLGAFATHAASDRDRFELYVLALDERDAAELPTNDRRLSTVGGRWLRAPARGAPDAEVEIAGQWGEVRASAAPTDTTDLDRGAWLLHAEIGHTLDRPAAPRFALAVDHTSGDEDPGDGRDDRFDALFGAPVPDFGRTGLYGPFRHGNQSSLTATLDARPRPDLRLQFAARRARLAERRDLWLSAGLRDPSGSAGRTLGTQLSARLDWRPTGTPFRAQVGASNLWNGSFAERAPGAPEDDSVSYFWLSTSLAF